MVLLGFRETQKRCPSVDINGNVVTSSNGNDDIQIEMHNTDRLGIPISTSHQTVYLPKTSYILLKRSDFGDAIGDLKLGDKFKQASCVPGTFTLDLSEESGATTDDKRFYMILVLEAEEGDILRCKSVYYFLRILKMLME